MDRSKWEYKKLGDCFVSIGNGATIKQIKEAMGIPITRIETLSNDVFNRDRMGYANIEDATPYSSYILNDGDILMSHINSMKFLGRAVEYKKLDNEVIIHGMNLLRLVPTSDFLSSYAVYQFTTDFFRKQIKAISHQAVNQASFNVSNLKRLNVIVPSLADQQRIVAELDCLNEMIAVKKEQLKEFDKLAQSIFYDMFGDPVSNEKKWKVYTLSSICDVRDGTHDSPQYVEEGYPLITSKNVIGGGISFDNVNYISKADLDSINARSRVDDGDIIMPMIGTIGNPVIVHKDREFAIKNVALIKFDSSTNVLNLYIQRLLDCESYSNYVMGLNRGGTQKFIALKTIRNLPIPLPPLSLQQQFADKISAIEAQKELVKQSIAETQALLDYSMDYYFNE